MREKKSKIPPHIDNAFRNLEDIFYGLTDSGWRNLDCEKAQTERMNITRLGILINLKNRDNQMFSLIVTPNYLSDVTLLRKEILTMADNLKKTFPNLLDKQTLN
jgi:hypothetical protein